MTPTARGFLVMGVREARWARGCLRAGDTFGALNRLCWAWRFLGMADRELEMGEGTLEGSLRSYLRASRAIDVVRDDFVAAWPQRTAEVRQGLRAASR